MKLWREWGALGLSLGLIVTSTGCGPAALKHSGETTTAVGAAGTTIGLSLATGIRLWESDDNESHYHDPEHSRFEPVPEVGWPTVFGGLTTMLLGGILYGLGENWEHQRERKAARAAEKKAWSAAEPDSDDSSSQLWPAEPEGEASPAP